MSTSVLLWRQMLQVAEKAPEEITDILQVVPNVRALASVAREDLHALPGWEQSQVLLMREWYLDWVVRGRPNLDDFGQEFTIDAFEEFTYTRR